MSPVIVVRTLLTMPYWVSKIQPHTITAASAGMAQANKSPIDVSRRKNLLSRIISSARRMPIAMVRNTQTTMKAKLRARTVQNVGSVSVSV
ncbi:hypothetical protein D3C74_397040 [compost metagenome]